METEEGNSEISVQTGAENTDTLETSDDNLDAPNDTLGEVQNGVSADNKQGVEQ